MRLVLSLSARATSAPFEQFFSTVGRVAVPSFAPVFSSDALEKSVVSRQYLSRLTSDEKTQFGYDHIAAVGQVLS